MLLAQSDYYPFGMIMNSDDAWVELSLCVLMAWKMIPKYQEIIIHMIFGARMYNPRVVRFFKRDPKEINYPWSSPYNYAAGRSPNHVL